MKKSATLRGLVPAAYVPVCIWLPIRVFDLDYGTSVLLLFWLPSLLLYWHLHSRLETGEKRALLVTSCVMVPVTFGFEYLCLALDIWDFYEGVDRLWGVGILGAPIEEFLFWFGATPFCLLLYLYYRRIIEGGSHAG